jgi:acetyl esterase/lipase
MHRFSSASHECGPYYENDLVVVGLPYRRQYKFWDRAFLGVCSDASLEVHMPAPEEMFKMRIVYTVPGMEAVTVHRDLVYTTAGQTELKMDVYCPAGMREGSRAPVVMLVHGGPIGIPMSPKDWGVFVSYGELLSASGLVAVTFNHRFYSPSHLHEAASDVAHAIDYVRGNADSLHVDKDRVGVWAFSGGGVFLSLPMRDLPEFVRCLVSYYAILDIQLPPPGKESEISEETRKEFSPLFHLAANPLKIPPIFIARAGLDNPWLNATVDRFIHEAIARNAALEIITHPGGHHGFDILDDDARSRAIIQRTLFFLKTHLEER